MPNEKAPILYAAILWLVLAAGLIVSTALGGGFMLSPDSAMRLVEVRDLLGGQSWFDTAQHRMNTPYGLPMHWSHLIDAGIGGLIVLFRVFTDAATAETWALYAWPLLPLLFVLTAIARIGTILCGRVGGWFALALAATCFAAAGPFQPGDIDHHNVQLALTLWFVAGLSEFERARWAAPVAALCACLSLAVGLETLPYIVAGVVALLVRWVIAGPTIAPAIRRFGVTLGAGSAVILFGAVADAYRFAAACDTFSGLYGVLGIAGGAGMFAMTAPIMAAPPARRILVVTVLALVVSVLMVAINPRCTHGPYAEIDPRIVPIWLAHITEARTPFYFLDRAPAFFVSGYVYAVFAAAASMAAIFLVANESRRAAEIVALFAVLATSVTSWQVRALPFALLLAMPGLAAFAIAGVRRLRLPPRTAAIVGALALFVASDALLPAAAAGAMGTPPSARAYGESQRAWQKACLTSAGVAPLSALPAGRVLATIDMGPAILVYTRHSVVGGAYHRNSAGILDTYAAMTGPPQRARDIVRSRGVDYIAVCPGNPDIARYRRDGGEQSLIARLMDGDSVAWLTPLPQGDSEVKLWRVVR